MSDPKAFYKQYIADDNMSELNYKLTELIMITDPRSVFELGTGTGKNLLELDRNGIVIAHYRNRLPFLIVGNESHLGHLGKFDVAFTCSVLDHIQNIDVIISELKRIAPVIFLAETNDIPAEYYYPHSYEDYGFTKLDFSWIGEDGATYGIWKYEVQ